MMKRLGECLAALLEGLGNVPDPEPCRCWTEGECLADVHDFDPEAWPPWAGDTPQPPRYVYGRGGIERLHD